MAKISRVYQRLFGSTAPGTGKGTIGQFGSLAAGTPTPSTDLATIQSLDAWLKGWLNAVIGNNGPTIEDMNGVFFVVVTQLAYLFQQGIAEWDATTPYYKGSKVNATGVIYTSITDNNVNNPVTDTTNWALDGAITATVTGNTSMSPLIDYYRVDASGGAVTMTLPAISSNPDKRFRIKKVDSSANVVTVKGNGSELIDFANTYLLSAPGESINVAGEATLWDIV